jgi:hypothetical protein
MGMSSSFFPKSSRTKREQEKDYNRRLIRSKADEGAELLQLVSTPTTFQLEQ